MVVGRIVLWAGEYNPRERIDLEKISNGQLLADLEATYLALKNIDVQLADRMSEGLDYLQAEAVKRGLLHDRIKTNDCDMAGILCFRDSDIKLRKLLNSEAIRRLLSNCKRS